MKKFLSIILSFCLIVLSSCDDKIYHWEIPYDISEIKEINIVMLKREGSRPPYKLLKSIDKESFAEICNDIENINMHRVFYDSSPSVPSYFCVQLIYNTNEFDLFYMSGPSSYNEKKDSYTIAHYTIDVQEYVTFLSKWYPEYKQHLDEFDYFPYWLS